MFGKIQKCYKTLKYHQVVRSNFKAILKLYFFLFNKSYSLATMKKKTKNKSFHQRCNSYSSCLTKAAKWCEELTRAMAIYGGILGARHWALYICPI